MTYWTAQTDEEHELELMERQLRRVERDHQDGWCTDVELEEARQDLKRAEAAQQYRTLMRAKQGMRADVAARVRRVALEMGVLR